MVAQHPGLTPTQTDRHGVTTARRWLADASRRLRAAGVDQPRQEAQLLLGHALNASTAGLLAHPERPIALDDAARVATLLARRCAREPFAYVVGEREFYGRPFAVDRRVLVPRPETELLVEQALAVLAAQRAGGVERPLVVDVGTGSGAVACTIALEAPFARVVAADLSADALAVADLNRRRFGLTEQVGLVRGDLLEWLRRPIDLVLANLPYLPTDRIRSLEPEVARFEPHLALDGGADGGDLARRLLSRADQHVRPGGTLLLELDPEQIPALARRVPGATARVSRDLAGFDRVLRVDLLSS